MPEGVTALLGAIVGALIAALASVFAARYTAQKQQQYIESARFRAEFVSELTDLRSGKNDVYKILTDVVVKRHHIAAINFEAWIPEASLVKFREAWLDYELNTSTSSPGSIGNRSDECEAAILKIEKILSFARFRY